MQIPCARAVKSHPFAKGRFLFEAVGEGDEAVAGELEQRPYNARPRLSAEDDVSVSEVAAYAYCAKAWHLEYVLGHGVDSSVEERRESGIADHQAHGKRLRRLQRVGRPLLRAAVILFALSIGLAITALVIGPR